MRKLLFTLAVVFTCFSVSMAQDDVFQKGDLVLGVGVGLGNNLGGTGYKSSIPPIVITGEYGLTDALIKKTGKGYVGVGGYLAYTANKYSWGDYNGEDAGWKYSYIVVGGRGAFHYQFVDKLDTYAGAIVGYNIASSSTYGPSGWSSNYTNSVGGFTYSTFVGARYYFTEKIAVYAEAGYGFNLLEAGLAFKF